MAAAWELPFQLSQTFSLPRKHFTNDTLDNSNGSESPTTQQELLWESPSVLGQGGRQLGGWDRMFLWSQGVIQALQAFLSESAGVGGGPWLPTSREDPWILSSKWSAVLLGCLSFSSCSISFTPCQLSDVYDVPILLSAYRRLQRSGKYTSALFGDRTWLCSLDYR